MEDDCPRCHRVFQPTEEQCPKCGFDPVNNEEDEKEYEAYKSSKFPKVEVSMPDGKKMMPAHYHDDKLTPDGMEGWEFMEVLGGGWWGFQV